MFQKDKQVLQARFVLPLMEPGTDMTGYPIAEKDGGNKNNLIYKVPFIVATKHKLTDVPSFPRRR